jgi:hypothetical protein
MYLSLGQHIWCIVGTVATLSSAVMNKVSKNRFLDFSHRRPDANTIGATLLAVIMRHTGGQTFHQWTTSVLEDARNKNAVHTPCPTARKSGDARGLKGDRGNYCHWVRRVVAQPES